MTAEDRMTLRDKWKVVRQVKPSYLKDSRSERSLKLDHLEETLRMHRKSIVLRMHSDLKRKPRSRQLGRTYGAPSGGFTPDYSSGGTSYSPVFTTPLAI